MLFAKSLSFLSLASLAVALPTWWPWPITRPGFVTTRGQQFVLDGSPFHFGGTNSYWLQFTSNTDDIEHIFDRAIEAGHRVVRTWGFHEVNKTFIPPEQGGLPRYNDIWDGAIYYQSWENGRPVLNTGATGLQHFDQLIRIAERKGVKLLISLTNNWADYGGMDVYTVNLGGQYHDDFFTNRRIVNTFKSYVRTIVTRYRDSPAVFAWELGNEPRCGADGTRNLPRSPDCNVQTVSRWADEMSTFIKSIDRNHLVTLGDEGFFNDPNDTSGDWAYNGADGVDFVANLRLRNLDFGTFHLYPDWWGKTVEWANDFVRAHGQAQRAVGKPVILEEYGWLSDQARLDIFGNVSNHTRLEVVGRWQQIAIEERLGGDMYWQFGLREGLSSGSSHDDGFTIFLENRNESVPLVYEHTRAMNRLR